MTSKEADKCTRCGVVVVVSKYRCHLAWDHDGQPYIRIGCECRTVEDWEANKEDLANKHDRSWWNEIGERIYEFFKRELEAGFPQKQTGTTQTGTPQFTTEQWP